ncbi:hypothetical protein LC653_36330 [Nostoc sp. CHAB 5784]|uniref:hypothetical protein n=1 Tax=Nostoc mirabile TaxID=2907820 RepID=UPI001E2E6A30|nr:hypothetical protein [Nostoc mirabile]MCC5669171.1 hypothetical protein [Nostoc mirabile CHAB5784]
MAFSEEPTVKNIRDYIKEKLHGRYVPHQSTVEKWLIDYGVVGVKTRIEEHVSYWEEKLAASSPTSDEILDALVQLIRDKLKK